MLNMLPDHFFAILNEFPALTYSSAASSVLDAPLQNVEHIQVIMNDKSCNSDF